MAAYLCITVRFADATFRGRADGGTAEWPPSPLRLFQALVAASAARLGSPDRFPDSAATAFDWLAGLHPPTIVAPAGIKGTPFRIAVPNNDMDVVARDWARRAEVAKQPAELKTLKTVQPTHIRGNEEFPAVHYVWEITETDQPGCERYKEALFAAARDLVALGWGTDMVAGHGRILSSAEIQTLEGEPWKPASETATTNLRIPTPGTFHALVARHAAFLTRVSEKGFVPVPPLTAFAVVGYRRPTDTVSRPFLAFEVRTPDFERFQVFDPVRHTCAVAGMVRNALADLARDMRPFGWTDADINTFVHGHTPDGEQQARGPDADRRFAYLPLPSLERRGRAGTVVTAIRRVLVVGPPGDARLVAWARVLSGRELTPLNGRTPRAALRLIDRPDAALRTDPNLGPYVGEGRVWSTVTPVVRPGYDDGDADKAERLLRKAFEQAGVPAELVRVAALEWRQVGFWAGLDLAKRYYRPEPSEQPRFHVRVRWPVPIRGPLFVGAARYRGLGTFAAEDPG
jgi:CRISPR-associated protein Csb2